MPMTHGPRRQDVRLTCQTSIRAVFLACMPGIEIAFGRLHSPSASEKPISLQRKGVVFMKKGNLIGLSLFVGLSLGLTSIPAVAQATNNNLVQNGSFEEGYEDTTQTNGGWPSNHGFWAPIGYAGATDTIPDWTVSGGGVDWADSDSSVPNSMVAADGDRLVDLNSTGTSGRPGGVIW